MPTITNKIIKAKRGGLLAVMAISTLGLVSTTFSSAPAYAQSKRALFASAAQCRTLTNDNAGLCCFALNRKLILSKQQLDMYVYRSVSYLLNDLLDLIRFEYITVLLF